MSSMEIKLVAVVCLFFVALWGEAYAQEAQTLCVAYSQDGDVFADCNSNVLRITHTGDIRSFAATPDGEALVLVRGVLRSTVEVLEPNQRHFLKVAPNRDAEFSCGTILLTIRARPEIGKATVTDVLTGAAAKFPDYVAFRCSADRKVVVGWTSRADRSLYIGAPPHLVASDVDLFGVSPDGQTIAYSTGFKTCVASDQSSIHCFDMPAIDRYSVSNLGQVLFTTQTDETCYYSDSLHATRRRVSSKQEQDACTGIALLSNAKGEPRIVHRRGRNPQWITAAGAESLANIGRSSHR